MKYHFCRSKRLQGLSMFKVEKEKDKAVITMYGYVGGYYLDFRAVAQAIQDVIQSGYKQLDIHMHTEGGSVFDGNMIFNLIASFKGEVDLYIDGIAASMGAIIIMAGKRIHIAENGFIMIHTPSGFSDGNARDHIEAAKLLRSIEKNFIQKLSARTGKDAAAISSEWLDGANHWFDADEAVTLKLADDKFTAVSGGVAITKAEASKMEFKSLMSSYVSLVRPEDQSTHQNQETDMKLVTAKLKMAETATEQEVVTAIEALESRANAAEQKLADYEAAKKAARKTQAETLVSAAITEQRIEATMKDTYLGMFEKDFDATARILAAIPKRVTAQQVVGIPTGTDNPLLKMTWDELDKKGKLAELKAKFPDVYKAKHDEQFPKGE